MGLARTSKAEAQAVVDAYAKANGIETHAAELLHMNRNTFQSRHREAKKRGLVPSEGIEDPNNLAHLKLRIKRLESELRSASEARLDASAIRNKIIGLRENVADFHAPAWSFKESKSGVNFGVPTLLVSDLHAGEVVDPKQINGVNEFNLRIFHERMERLAERTIRLLSILSPNTDYPGICVPLGGDNISGNIHDELTATNEFNSMPTVLDVFETLASFLTIMADQFKHVFIPCESGNHGRDTKKIWKKDRHHTSFDWLIYCFLAKHFANDPRFVFFIPDSPDAYYKLYDYKYCLTHGDQFRSFGDSMIGALGPIIRGDVKKRSRNSQIDLEYDTLIMGHWHQYIHLTRLIVNGSVKGYDEYGYDSNFPFERPQQALWLTHPTYGITYRCPVYVGKKEEKILDRRAWVSVAK